MKCDTGPVFRPGEYPSDLLEGELAEHPELEYLPIGFLQRVQRQVNPEGGILIRRDLLDALSVGLDVLRDRPGQTNGDYVTKEGEYTTAYALFTPTGEHAQYAICSPIVDEFGTVYFKNDSAYLMAYGSAVESIEITKMPDRMVYAPGETFDPTGMVVTAVYANGKSRDVTAYVTFPTEPLTEQDTLVTITFPHVLYQNQENGTEMQSGVASATPTALLELTFGQPGKPGDVNGDGMVNALDAQLILDIESGLKHQSLPLAAADVSGDGVIDSNDAVLILQYAAGEIETFPCE